MLLHKLPSEIDAMPYLDAIDLIAVHNNDEAERTRGQQQAVTRAKQKAR